MPENLELIEPDKYYHIYNHAIGGENLFLEDKNYLFFSSINEKIPYPNCRFVFLCSYAKKRYNLKANHNLFDCHKKRDVVWAYLNKSQ